ncbi:hypothetical protein [Nocardioides dongkuii]|uniref:hypothetical protein n=1 Tax=Nocardioides dongkuii TaxID=2760089 RepID=UPI0015F8B980|nr:hypothetical protein [Nocardioides dongkuii]
MLRALARVDAAMAEAAVSGSPTATYLAGTMAASSSTGSLYLLRVEAPRQLVDDTPLHSAMVTFWLRQDQQDTGLAEVVAEVVNAWLLDEWPLAAHAFRVLPGERSSCAALDRLGLRKLRLSFLGDERPYLWYLRSIWQLSRAATES